mgnify:CR=1 FL=1
MHSRQIVAVEIVGIIVSVQVDHSPGQQIEVGGDHRQKKKIGDHPCQPLTGEPALVGELGADGLHLDSKALAACSERPLPDYYLVAVSAHSLEALQQGEAMGASFGVLSPINYTSAHPDIEPIGWEGMRAAVEQLKIPLYALGGVTADDQAAAVAAGGLGIAGNKGLWQL